MPFNLSGLLWAHAVTLGIDAALTALLFYPLGWFIFYDWCARRDEFCSSLDKRAQQSYLTTFRKMENLSEDDAPAAFKQFYYDWFGRRKFILPLGFLLLVAVIEDFILAEALQKLVLPGTRPKDFEVAAAAIAGGYTFVCWDLFNRMQRRILSSEDVLRASLRLVIAVPVGFAFGALLAEGLAPFVAFAMGAFPISTLNVILQRQIKKRLELEIGDPKAARDQVFLLSGIDTAIAERLEDADISTITQLAWPDPIDLAIRTNLQFAFIIDIVSQALAWAYLEDKLKPLSAIGLRGAIEIRFLLEDLGVITDEVVKVAPTGRKKKEADDDYEAAKAALKAAAKLAKVDEAALMYGFVQIGKDPTAEFLELTWESLTEGR